MPYSDGNYLTEKGRALLAKLMASQAEIEFTRASVGSGSIPEGKAPKDMEALTNWQVNGVISDISSPVAGEAHLVFQVFSRDVKVGFLATEAAIWANDPDEGEILYTYIVLDNTPEWIRAASDPVQKFAEFTCINLVGTAPIDMTVINPEAIASRQFMLDTLKKHNSDENAHPSIRAEINAKLDEVRAEIASMDTSSIIQHNITIPADGWVQCELEEFDGYRVDVPLADVTESMIPIISIIPNNLTLAGSCGLSTCAKTGDGYVRLYSRSALRSPVNASAAFLVPSAGAGGGSYHLPIASKNRLGGVKIGDNIAIANDGTISVDNNEFVDSVSATNEEAQSIINKYFKDN